MKIHISKKQIWQQLKSDLIGKDSYRGVSLTYAWLANQFGHFALGFIPALVLFSIYKRLNAFENNGIAAATTITILWVLFETYNFLGPLLLNKKSKSEAIFIQSDHQYVFSPAWKNVAFDTITDLLYFAFGAFSASLFIKYSMVNLYIVVALVVLLIWPSYYWYVTKMYIQSGNFPYQMRLSQWSFRIDEGSKKVVEEYLNKCEKGKHLFVFGGKGSGKSSLCVALATEKSISHLSCYYTTGMKLYTVFGTKEIDRSMLHSLWSWEDVQYLVIDDINPGPPVKKDLIMSDQFLTFTSRVDQNGRNRNHEIISKKNVIWVLGDGSEETYLSWRAMLVQMSVKPENIFVVKL